MCYTTAARTPQYTGEVCFISKTFFTTSVCELLTSHIMLYMYKVHTGDTRIGTVNSLQRTSPGKTCYFFKRSKIAYTHKIYTGWGCMRYVCWLLFTVKVSHNLRKSQKLPQGSSRKTCNFLRKVLVYNIKMCANIIM